MVDFTSVIAKKLEKKDIKKVDVIYNDLSNRALYKVSFDVFLAVLNRKGTSWFLTLRLKSFLQNLIFDRWKQKITYFYCSIKCPSRILFNSVADVIATQIERNSMLTIRRNWQRQFCLLRTLWDFKTRVWLLHWLFFGAWHWPKYLHFLSVNDFHKS